MGMHSADRRLLEAAIEREEIVKRYDRGLDPDAPVDEWENPKLEIYHTTDRYGFIHDSRLPEKKNDEEKATEVKETERIDKWTKMINDWNKYFGKDKAAREKLWNRIWKGIPNRWRPQVWTKLLKIEDVMEVGMYEKMREKARRTSPDIRQIDLDVNRTYRNHIMFRERYGTKQKHLFHVLAAYSMYNTQVGYCQGMSQIAALLLMYMDEEHAFWGLHQLLTYERYAMHGLFIPGFPKLLRYQDHFEYVLKKFNSKIFKFLNKNMIPPSLYAIKWFMQVFLDRTPFTLTLRLYDIYLLEGERMLIPMAYTIFKLHKKKLLTMSMEACVHFLQQDLEKDFGATDDVVIKELRVSMEELRSYRADIPPKPKTNAESPPEKYGVEQNLPTLEELQRRQAAQIHLNDETGVKKDSISSDKAVSVKPKTATNLASQDSFCSDYDNQPAHRKVALPPVDYETSVEPLSNQEKSPVSLNDSIILPANNQPSQQTDIIMATQHRLDTKVIAGITSQEPSDQVILRNQKLSRPRSNEESKVVVNSVRDRPTVPDGSLRITRKRSDDVDDVELKLSLSEDENVSTRRESSQRSTLQSNQSDDSIFEKKPEILAVYNRESRSQSKSPDDLDISSSHMFVRSAGFRSPRSQQNSVTSVSSSLNSPTEQIRRVPSTTSSTHSETVRLTSPNAHKSSLKSLDYKLNNNVSTAPVIKSPDERPAYNPGYISESLRRRTNLSFHSQGAQANIYISSNEAHTRNTVSAGTSLQTGLPTNQFSTFGGRGKNPPQPPPRQNIPIFTNQATYDSLSFGLEGTEIPPVSRGATAQTLPPKLVSTTNKQIPTKKTYYVISHDSHKSPSRYQFNEDDPSNPPVYL